KLVPEAVGRAVANDLFFTGRRLSAEEALGLGLVARVFAPGELQESVQRLAQQVAAMAPNAARRAKALVKYDHAEIGERMAEEGAIFAEQLRSPEFSESIAALRDKRAPEFP
ncbi:MAG: enoyl-CoA hydratase-related protein, partial [Myxococcota bacterium]